MSLIEGSGGDLTNYLPERFKNHYAIEFVNGRPRTIFPIGVSVLAAPFVGVIALIFEKVPAGRSLEKELASLFGAAAAVVFFWVIFLKFERLPIALATTFIFSLCTSMWSLATRALLQHGPLVLMLVIAMLLIQLAKKRPSLIQYVSLPLAMAYVIRPTASIPIVVLTAYIFIYHRGWFVKYLSWAMLIAVPFIAFNYTVYGKLLSQYYLGAFTYEGSSSLAKGSLAEAAAGNLISPARGLFVYSPVLLFSLSGFALALRDKEQRPLHLAYGITVSAMFIAISLTPRWWAGWGFGPRYMTDLVPFLAYFTAFNFEPVRWRAAVVSGIGILTAISLIIHAQGALRIAPWGWNEYPEDVDLKPSRIWDWSDPAFLR
jgi:hypothetical protein